LLPGQLRKRASVVSRQRSTHHFPCKCRHNSRPAPDFERLGGDRGHRRALAPRAALALARGWLKR
jgi:hypothetical protein